MSITASIVAIVILLAALFLLRRTQKSIVQRPTAKPPARPSAGQPDNTKFHAVSIRVASGACAAAMGMQGERFLATEAPQLPLPGCDAADCQCRFIHFKDRRTIDERRDPYRGTMGATTGNLQQEQRTGKDRRKSPRD
jgi:hypothetical protein